MNQEQHLRLFVIDVAARRAPLALGLPDGEAVWKPFRDLVAEERFKRGALAQILVPRR